MITIGIVAGEPSGDALGADFMRAMYAIYPTVRFVGVGGSAMAQEGLESVIDMNRLSVMGLIEVIRHLPDLQHAKQDILQAFELSKINVFVGIDAPDFNLRLAKVLKPKGIFCVQYVSPSIWAWRENRIHAIKQATDLVLCLFGFETAVYNKHHHPAVCVGHPLVKATWVMDKASSQQQLADYLPKELFENQVVCLMPGSRDSEIKSLLPLLLQAFGQLKQDMAVSGIIAVASINQLPLVKQIISDLPPQIASRVYCIWQKPAQTVIASSDVVLVASGTATLECLLIGTPMVVVYKMNPVTYQIAKRLVKTPYVALPNILSYDKNQRAVVPELIQHEACPNLIADYAKELLYNPKIQTDRLRALVKTIQQEDSNNPAQVVLNHYHQFKQTVIR